MTEKPALPPWVAVRDDDKDTWDCLCSAYWVLDSEEEAMADAREHGESCEKGKRRYHEKGWRL